MATGPASPVTVPEIVEAISSWTTPRSNPSVPTAVCSSPPWTIPSGVQVPET